MAISPRYRELRDRLKELRTNFLFFPFSPTGTYSTQQFDLAKAYVVLAHAELESYFEDRAKEKAQKAVLRWQARGHHTRVLTRMLDHFQLTQNPEWRPASRTPQLVNRATRSFFGKLSVNHGIREPNLCRLLFPIGLRFRDLDTVWLATLESFSKSRGELAHTGFKTHQPIDPATELKRIREEILPGIRALDRKITKL